MIDIDKLEALEKAATPGPWLAKANELLWVGPDSLARHGRIVYPTLEDECIFRDGNAEMIAAVRNALPELLAEVRRLRLIKKTSDASASTLHAGIMSLINRHHGPPSIWDFTSWIDGELIRLREALAEVRRLRQIEEAAKEVAANEAEDIDSRLRYVSVQPGRDEWAALKAALCKQAE